METLKDLKCHDCRKWLDLNTMTCDESGRRICGKCYAEIKSGSECPACQNDIGMDDHFLPDYCARKKVKDTRACCKSCGEEMVLAHLRDHEVECRETVVLEDDALMEDEDYDLDDGIDERENENVLVDEHDTGERDNDELDDGRDEREHENILDDQVQSCEYRSLGCLFKGTCHELAQHMWNPPLQCVLAKELKKRLMIAEDQEFERALIWLDIRTKRTWGDA